MMRFPSLPILFFLFCLSISMMACQEALMSGLSEKQANDIYWYLNEHKIEATKIKSKKGYEITITPKDFQTAWEILRRAGLTQLEDLNHLQSKESQWWMSQKDKDQLIEFKRAQDIKALLEAYPSVFTVQLIHQATHDFILVKVLSQNKKEEQDKELEALAQELTGLLKGIIPQDKQLSLKVEPLPFYQHTIKQEPWLFNHRIELFFLGLALILAISGIYLGVKKK